MTEILTESFCERCGTRYTFESTRPRARMKGVKVLSRGLKNFVLSDDTSMDEAMAAARSETDREATAHQLDAFHKTFNFCMSCRQYTCPNCWNEVEARCLSCAPHLGHEIMPAPFPDMPIGLVAADPLANGAGATNGTNGANGTNGTNGAFHEVELIGVAETEALRRDDEIDASARLEALTAPAVAAAAVTAVPETVEPGVVADVPEPVAEVEAAAEPVAEVVAAPVVETAPVADVEVAAVDPVAEVVAEPVAEAMAEPVAEAVAEPVVEPEPVQAVADHDVEPVVEAVAEPVVEPEPVAEIAADHDVDDAAVAARLAAIGGAAIVADARTSDDAPASRTFDEKLASQTSGLLQRFRPGQSLDAELDAYEREQAGTTPETPVDAPAASVESDAIVEPGAIAAASVVESEPAITTEPAIVVAEAIIAAEAIEAAGPDLTAQPDVVAEPAAETPLEPEAAAPAAPVAAEPEIAVEPEVAAPAAPVVDDVVPQPMWHMVAPEAAVDAPPVQPPAAPTTSVPVASNGANQPEPQWPTRPVGSTISRGLPFLGRPAAPQGGLEALWAESTREVVATPAVPGKAVAGAVQPCVSCGLSLSATARFCRRCGAAQGS